MTIRLDVNVDSTQELLGAILQQLNKGERAMFLVPPGMSEPILQRVRVKLSRIRNGIRQRGGKIRHFILRSSVHPHTEGGKRFDCVVVWRDQLESQRALEILEDMVGHGQSI